MATPRPDAFKSSFLQVVASSGGDGGSLRGALPCVTPRANEASPQEALRQLRRLSAGAPLVDRDRDFAHWLSMALAIAGRHLIPNSVSLAGTPVFIFESDAPNIGKRMLIETAFAIGTGELSEFSLPFSSRYRTIARRAAADNRRCLHFHSAPDGRWQPAVSYLSRRRLGTDGRPKPIDSQTVFALSGERLSLGDHEANHAVVVRLRSGGRPARWHRQALTIPDHQAHVREHLHEYHAAVLTILSTAMPGDLRSAVPCEYAHWSRVACEPLDRLGLPCPQVVDYVGMHK